MFRNWAGSSTARRGGSEVHPAKWRLGRKFQSVPAAPQARRSIGDRVGFGRPPPHHPVSATRTNERWPAPITAPCSNSRPPRSGRSSATSTIIRSGFRARVLARSRTAIPPTPSALVRSVHFCGMHIRQRLLAQSDVEWSQTRILRRPGAAGHRLSIDHSRLAGRGRRAGVRGVVGDVRLRRGPPRRVDRDAGRLVREMARIAARHHGRLRPGGSARTRSGRSGVVSA